MLGEKNQLEKRWHHTNYIQWTFKAVILKHQCSSELSEALANSLALLRWRS